MGVLARLTRLQAQAAPSSFDDRLEASAVPQRIPYASPYGPFMDTISLAISPLFPDGLAITGRAAAQQLPPLSKGRNAIQILASIPMVAYRRDERLDPQPRWLSASAHGSPWLRLQATIDDLVYDGLSLWAVERGARNAVLDAMHVDLDEWDIDPDGKLKIQGQEVAANSVCLFQGPLVGGILTTGRNTIAAGLDLEQVWAGRVSTPVPLIDLHQTDDTQLTPAEKDALVGSWNAARKSKTGAVATTPSNIDAREMGSGAASDLLVEGRNQIAVDIASHLGLPVSATNSSLATSTLTYKTQQGEASQFREALTLWSSAITARLSEDDMSPMGQRVGFDIESFDTATGSVTDE